MNKLSIKQIPLSDRPYEKFEKLGEAYLTDAELLAVIIKNGSRSLNCLEIAKYILASHSNGLSGFSYLKEVSLDELMKIPGIGRIKAIQLKAIIELANRINNEFASKRAIKITSPSDVYKLLKTEMSEKQTEEVRVVILDNKNYVKSVVTVSKGATNKSVISAKEILSEPIKQLATGIILVHNHPSGDTTPSRQDVLLTRKISDYAKIFEIDLCDHVIIGKNGYTSLKETNSEIFIGGKML